MSIESRSLIIHKANLDREIDSMRRQNWHVAHISQLRGDEFMVIFERELSSSLGQLVSSASNPSSYHDVPLKQLPPRRGDRIALFKRPQKRTWKTWLAILATPLCCWAMIVNTVNPLPRQPSSIRTAPTVAVGSDQQRSNAFLTQTSISSARTATDVSLAQAASARSTLSPQSHTATIQIRRTANQAIFGTVVPTSLVTAEPSDSPTPLPTATRQALVSAQSAVVLNVTASTLAPALIEPVRPRATATPIPPSSTPGRAGATPTTTQAEDDADARTLFNQLRRLLPQHNISEVSVASNSENRSAVITYRPSVSGITERMNETAQLFTATRLAAQQNDIYLEEVGLIVGNSAILARMEDIDDYARGWIDLFTFFERWTILNL